VGYSPPGMAGYTPPGMGDYMPPGMKPRLQWKQK
jgi:hypothetical protein